MNWGDRAMRNLASFRRHHSFLTRNGPSRSFNLPGTNLLPTQASHRTMERSVNDHIQARSSENHLRNSKRHLLGCIKDGGDSSTGGALANGGTMVDNGCVTLVVSPTPDDVTNKGHNEGKRVSTRP